MNGLAACGLAAPASPRIRSRAGGVINVPTRILDVAAQLAPLVRAHAAAVCARCAAPIGLRHLAIGYALGRRRLAATLPLALDE